MRSRFLCIVLIAAIIGALAPPAAAGNSSGSWLDWLSRLWQWLNGALDVINQVRYAIGSSAGVWWSYALHQISTALGLDEVADTLQYLATLASRLPGDIGGWIGSLIGAIQHSASSVPPDDSPEGVYSTVVRGHPALKQLERQSLNRQVQSIRLVAESEATRQASEDVAQQVVTSTAAQEAAASALESADRLQQGVQDAQSSRALLQYLGEGVADLMRQQATLNTVVVQNLQAMNQQQALSNREMQLIVTALAQKLLDDERARKARAQAMQEALRALGEGYGQSLAALGSSLVDMQEAGPQRRATMEEAITPR